MALLFVEMWGLARIGASDKSRSLSSLLSLGGSGSPCPIATRSPTRARTASLGYAYVACLAVLLPTAVASAQGLGRQEITPLRQAFVDFPASINGWDGTTLVMEQAYTDILRFDDYILADYQRAPDAPVNFYVAYYGSQKKGQSAHSPRTCIPGGGWEIVSIDDLGLPGSHPITVNRVRIQKDDQKQLVLYWFQQRGRSIANEYLVKWFLVWDLITRQRSDGALVRLTTAIGSGETESEAEGRLMAFAETIQPVLTKYVPD